LAVLAIHVLASVVLIARLEGPWQMWLLVLGPGLTIAAVRLALTADGLRRGK
jgi:hypothetical protein